MVGKGKSHLFNNSYDKTGGEAGLSLLAFVAVDQRLSIKQVVGR